MNQDQKLDQLERLARLFCQRPLHPRRESRKSAAKLRDYVTAVEEYDIATQALEAKPNALEMKDNLRRAKEALDRAREELKH
jgi:hypothetical protein